MNIDQSFNDDDNSQRLASQRTNKISLFDNKNKSLFEGGKGQQRS
jgi:hypothetical protein